jgi:RNA polymerase sigma-70 factor (ECF subfamily)
MGRIMIADQQGEARDALFQALHAELYRMAAKVMAGERRDHTLQPSALLNEVWLRFARASGPEAGIDRGRLISMAGRAMREVLVDHARGRKARKRGGHLRRVPLDDVLDDFSAEGLDVQAVREALDELAGTRDRQATVMTLRFIGGFTVPEVAEQLGVSVRTVEYDYRLARAWLRRRLEGAAR